MSKYFRYKKLQTGRRSVCNLLWFKNVCKRDMHHKSIKDDSWKQRLWIIRKRIETPQGVEETPQGVRWQQCMNPMQQLCKTVLITMLKSILKNKILIIFHLFNFC
uniref:Uncharacterized protein n=1 Tax=Arion vulgaris TaxID=1028688 RepID=A0A0B6Z1H0_9EUPU